MPTVALDAEEEDRRSRGRTATDVVALWVLANQQTCDSLSSCLLPFATFGALPQSLHLVMQGTSCSANGEQDAY